MFLFYLFYILCLLVAPCLRKSRNSCKCIYKTSSKLDGAIYWHSLITLINESYMIITICLLINMKIIDWSSQGL